MFLKEKWINNILFRLIKNDYGNKINFSRDNKNFSTLLDVRMFFMLVYVLKTLVKLF